ncbi:hypothetical protein SmJEL517_g02704 [Synchytrium microbalum]|uniref:Peptide hydrolase n=1 Tax=Synchytrium microbalum TaxID=1806994 RepID=A0A507C9K0_9FUNG|nr:uncharacterized protein SmJEL517_g02704 [Synchytrium microbalum]TPX34666.1 hypothetical protein SmJEL517_g02704 [Synchytrium microbalum]
MILQLWLVAVLFLFGSDNVFGVESRLLHSRFLSTAATRQDLTSIRNLSDLQTNLSLNSSTSILDPLLIERVAGSEGNLKVQSYIKTYIKQLGGWTIEEDSFKDTTPYGVKPFNNIIATFDPSAERKLVVAAHFDSKYFEKGLFIGATDSAVPCAILLDVAKALTPLLQRQLDLTQHGIPNNIQDTVNDFALGTSTTLQLIFFDGEEAFKEWSATDSLYGARHLAKKWDESHKLGSISLFVLLDLLGAPAPSLVNMNQNTEYAWNRLADINSRLTLLNVLAGTHRYFNPGSNSQYYGGVEDDHKPFQERGVPVVHVIPVPFPNVWHTLRDDATALDMYVVRDLALIFRIFVYEYLGLAIQ